MFLTSKLSQTDVTIKTQRSLLPPCTFSFDGYCVLNKVLLMLDDKFVLNSKIQDQNKHRSNEVRNKLKRVE